MQYIRRPMHELCEITSSKRIYASDYAAAGVPFYRGKEITEKHRGKLDVSTDLFISRSKFAEVSARFGAPAPGDLLLTSVGTLGSPYVVREGEEFYFKDGNITWFRRFRGLDSRFLYYWLLSPSGRAELTKCTIGSSQSAYTIVLLKQMDIELPPMTVQLRVAGILSEYDELIENCERRVRALDEMARVLFREWFVLFRYPGHERVPLVESSLGPIPSGWTVERMDRAFEFESGRAIKKSARQSGAVPVFGANGIIGNTSLSAMAPRGIVLGKIGSCGALHRSNEPLWVTNNAFLVRPAQIRSEELSWRILQEIDFNRYVGGAANPYMPLTSFAQHEVVVATTTVQATFASATESMERLGWSLRAELSNLRETRDLLLPRLLSGQLCVEDAA